MLNYSQIAFQVPSDLQTFTIQSGKNTLIIREPVAADYLLAESAAKNPNIHERAFILAERLAVSWNGEPGVSAVELGMLNRPAYKQLLEMTSQFFLDIMPSIGTEFIQKYLQNENLKFPTSDQEPVQMVNNSSKSK